ncbi:Uncharacterized protein TCM_015604 [Theobroma cacao]|uniref:Uncharacterized protein n=1 Tax=Theobroma cacao TaxID=3641 RepID=A0A061G3Q8_THECC|nr:Uncharacterized protein TCM_015604 [Theobroma cacao]
MSIREKGKEVKNQRPRFLTPLGHAHLKLAHYKDIFQALFMNLFYLKFIPVQDPESVAVSRSLFSCGYSTYVGFKVELATSFEPDSGAGLSSLGYHETIIIGPFATHFNRGSGCLTPPIVKLSVKRQLVILYAKADVTCHFIMWFKFNSLMHRTSVGNFLECDPFKSKRLWIEAYPFINFIPSADMYMMLKENWCNNIVPLWTRSELNKLFVALERRGPFLPDVEGYPASIIF